jgi:FlaA1/EpsC-like NDP-sugar epimerase
MEHTGLKDAAILITGGTGSFGNRVAARMLEHNPKEVRIFSRDEKKQWEMRQVYPQFRYFLGDVRNRRTLKNALNGVDYVFHAAALKQVPSCESFPWEAAQTNVIGAQNLCEEAREAGVKVVVALSTDKAVKPVNAMGISKALMEKIVCSQNEFACKTVFCCVRYGNVMGSRGSVIPLFKKQIREQKPISMTVPTMTRFLMTLDQSVDLVFRAMTKSAGGELYVRRAPACTVKNLARAVARLQSPLGLAYPMVETGIRPGEKLHEVLVNEYELQRASEEDDYFVIQPEYRKVRASSHSFGEEYTSANTHQLEDLDQIIGLLREMGETESYL